MKITRETDHAIKCILYLSVSTGELVSITEISKNNDIPKAFLAKIIQKLAKKGIIISQKGNQGGIRLAKNPVDLSLYDVLKAIQELPVINECIIDTDFCERQGYCSIHGVWKEIQQDIIEKLKKINFAYLLKKEFDRLKRLSG